MVTVVIAGYLYAHLRYMRGSNENVSQGHYYIKDTAGHRAPPQGVAGLKA